MARVPGSQPLLPSVLNRLMDPTGVKRMRELKEYIRRDLEDLLNTRWRCVSWPRNLDELDVSLVNYGIPDFTGANLGSPENQEEFRRVVEQVIRNFEPRFKSVTVTLLRNPEALDRTLRFRIEATLHTEPAPEPVVFDSALEPLTASFQVKEGGR
ncbi:MAG: type VI secretion system baseplate subunit TssE [Planctomycetes bacterium]|nr:type VI secretion system baseplate subunit TssE [Planctomycetota bacterium]